MPRTARVNCWARFLTGIVVIHGSTPGTSCLHFTVNATLTQAGFAWGRLGNACLGLMAAGDLTKPLGLDRAVKTAERRSLPVGSVMAGLSLALLGSIAGFLILSSNPLGGEPIAFAAIDRMAKRDTGPAPAEEKAEAPPSSPNVREMPRDPSRERSAAQRQDANDLETESGVRVVRSGGSQAPGSVVIRVPDATPSIKLAALDKRLAERGRHGALPKQGPNGLRPADVYARPVTPQQRAAPAKVAIVIGGLGISGNATQAAIQRLGPTVSLAFAPYGSDLERQVARAREDGHEVLLHAPMEPFDYPDNDPGPHTLLSSQTSEQTVERLHWVMGQFQGYVGLINFMGGRFTSNEAALSPVMRELAARGLLYIDDGSSGRSLAAQTADGAGVSAGKADVVLDAIQRSKEIDAALAKLERIAKEKGSAVGYAAGLPVNVDRIARWMKDAEARGITLVPVSALVTSPKRS
eukprot:gene19049-24870_t